MTATTEVAAPSAAPPPAKQPTIKGWLQSQQFLAEVSRALPRHMTAERFTRIALTATTRTPDLLNCTPASVLRCLMDLSALGLEPDGRRAHLIPYKRNQKDGGRWVTTLECQLIVDYKGIVELVLRSGDVSRIHADVVCENDDFEFDRGAITRHRIDLRKPRGKVYAAYCVILMKDGNEVTQVLSRDEIEAVRARSKAKDSGPWVTDWNEMAKKTAFRRASKWVRWSSEDLRDQLNRAEEVEEEPYVKAAPEEASIDLAQFIASADSNRGHGNEIPEAADVESGDRPNVGAEPISEDQVAQIEAARVRAKLSPKQLAEMLQQYGFASVRAVTVATFASVLKALEGGDE
jgi:recombination protein RecT